MRQIVYYVASSLDGYISGPDQDISGFVPSGNGVDQYLEDLKAFDTVIMGRKTYEFGYDFGLKPGQLAYPHMKHYVFSNSLNFENPHQSLKVVDINLEIIEQIQLQPGTDIYLCGGGQLAGWLLNNKKIDVLKIKLNPLVLGDGIKMFGDTSASHRTELMDHQIYEHGLQIITYKVHY